MQVANTIKQRLATLKATSPGGARRTGPLAKSFAQDEPHREAAMEYLDKGYSMVDAILSAAERAGDIRVYYRLRIWAYGGSKPIAKTRQPRPPRPIITDGHATITGWLTDQAA